MSPAPKNARKEVLPTLEITPEESRRYLLTVFITFLIVYGSVWAYVVTFPEAFMESGYAAWATKKAMLANCQLGQIDFFGDSRLEAGIVPADLPVPATNLGLAAGTAIEVRVAVDRALRCPDRLHQAVISLVPEHFGPLSQFYWLLSLRYGFLSFGDVLAVESLASQLGDSDSLATQTPDALFGRPRDWLYVSGFPTFSFASLVKGRLFGRLDSNRARMADILRDRGWTAYVGGEPVKAAHPDQFVLTKLQNAELEAAIAALRAKNIPTALLIMPFSPGHQETDATLAAYRDYLAAVAGRTGAVLLDPTIPIWPASAFADGAHLAPPAAHAFTQALVGCLKGGVLEAPCVLTPP